MLVGVSTNGTGVILVQIGSSSYTTSGYTGILGTTTTLPGAGASVVSSGFGMAANVSAATSTQGNMNLMLVGSNTWVYQGSSYSRGDSSNSSSGYLALGGTLDRVRVIASNTGSPADTFDAGTVNVLYEG